MRKMTEAEIKEAADTGKWGTICTLGEDLAPYAIEASYFIDDNGRVCFMINPRGTTMTNISKRDKVVVKITFTGPGVHPWAGVSCFGTACVETDKDVMVRGWELLGRAMGADYSAAAKRFSTPEKPSPMLAVTPERWTGQCSHKQGESMDFSLFLQ